MKKLIALFVVLTLTAGMTSVHALQVSQERIRPQINEKQEYTEEEMISILTGTAWVYMDPVKETAIYLELEEDGTGTMEIGDVSYGVTWHLQNEREVAAVLEAEGITYEYVYRLRVRDSDYELCDTAHRRIIWKPVMLF